MSKYNRFEDFMTTVIDEAEAKSYRRYGSSLKNTSVDISKMVKSLIDKGWYVFAAVVVLLSLGYLGFAAALIAFATTPIGIVVAVVLAAWGGIAGIKILRENKQFPIAVKKVGDRYKLVYERLLNMNDTSSIDCLIDKASDDLIKEAML